MGYFLIGLVSCIVTGAIAEVIAKSKNRKGFWWGFWLSWIGIIVVACMPTNKSKYERLEQLQELKEKQAITIEEFEKEKNRLLNS